MDELLVQTLFCMTNTMVLHQSVTMQTDMLRNLLTLWSQLFADRHLNMAYSVKHYDLIETMLYDLLKQRSQNTELQNTVLEAIIRWIYYYWPQMNGNHTVSLHKITKLCATLLQIPSFGIHSRYIHSLTNASTSHQLCYFMLHQFVQNNNPRTTTMKPSTLNDLKCILSHTTNNGYNEDNLYIVLQLIQTIRIKATKQQQCVADIDKIINICYSIAIHHSPSSKIGLTLSAIADNNGCFGSLRHKLPKKYKQRNNGNVPLFDDKHKQSQIQMYQNQLCSVLETPLIRGRNIHHHPMRAFGHSDLNDSFEDISLDISRNKRHCAKQQKAHSVPIQNHYLCTMNEPNDDDFKEAETETNSDKENATNKGKMSGNKRKRDSEMKKEDDEYGNSDDRPSAAKKAKYTNK